MNVLGFVHWLLGLLFTPNGFQGVMTFCAAVYAGNVALRVAEDIYPRQKKIDRNIVWHAEKRKLYADFIAQVDEAFYPSGDLGPGNWTESHAIRKLWSQLAQIRLVASEEVADAAAGVITAVVAKWAIDPLSNQSGLILNREGKEMWPVENIQFEVNRAIQIMKADLEK